MLATQACMAVVVVFLVALGAGTARVERHHEPETSTLGELGRAVARGVRTLDRLS